jgi:hypothetical protein
MGFERLADIIAGTLGAHQIGLAAQNAHHDSRGGFNSSSERDVRMKVQTALTRQQ